MWREGDKNPKVDVQSIKDVYQAIRKLKSLQIHKKISRLSCVCQSCAILAFEFFLSSQLLKSTAAQCSFEKQKLFQQNYSEET